MSDSSIRQRTDEDLSIRVLGGISIQIAQQSVTEHLSTKSAALLVYLACRPGIHQRDALRELLWSSDRLTSGSTNLRVALSNLRRVAGPFLHITRHTVEVQPAASIWVDALRMEQLITQGMHQCQRGGGMLTREVEAQLERALELYAGEFLANLAPLHATKFETWMRYERAHYHALVQNGYQILIDSYLANHQFQLGMETTRRWLELDRSAEQPYRSLMRLFERAGRPLEALEWFEICRRNVWDRYHREPSPETQALYEQIAQVIGRGSVEHRHLVTPLRTSHQPVTIPPNNVPASVSPIVNRQAELNTLERLLLESDSRLLTIAGPGGVGKTRLAQELAHNLLHRAAGRERFPDGIYVVPLEKVETGGHIAQAIFEELSLQGGDPTMAIEDQLLSFLHERRLLLILDNVEHLSPKTTVTLRLLHGAAGLKIIITSRARLNYSDERVVEIGGLTYPERYEAGDYLDRYPACRLFLQYAQIDHPERLPGEEQTAIARICQQLDGLPLGIRLAAAMMRIYSCQEIAANLTRTLDFAVAETSELPPRHTSLRAMFEHSWKLLNEEQRQAYARLSVFSGGFTTGAAAEVAGVSPQQLLDLVHRSLVHAITPGTDDLSMSVDRRCRLHPVLQTYAAEQLERQPELAEDTRQRHCRYYAAYTQRNDVTLGSQLLAQQMRAIEVELYNICRAWSFSVQRRELAYLEQMIWCLVHYFGLRGPFQRGEQLLDEAKQALADDDAPAGTASERILAKIYTAQALLANRFAHYPAAIDAVRQTLDSDAADSETRIVAELEWGRASFHLADYANARLHLEAALHSSQTANLPHWELRALSMLGLVLLYMGEHERGVQLSHAALRASRKHDLLLDEARLLTQLGMIYFYQGRYQSAQQYYTYALHTCESVNDRAGSLATIISMGAVAQQLGDYEEARRLYHRALDLGKSIGDRNYEAVTTANLGLIAYHQGNLDQALSYLKQAHTLAISRGQRDVEAFTQTCRGHVYHAQGELGSAAQAYQQAFQLREALTQKHQLMEPLAGLALVAVDSGDVELAHRYASQMLSVIKSPWYSAAVDFFRVLWACYRALQAAHDTRAAALLAEAYQRLLARATQLDDENLKQSYLSRVAIHRQIVEEFQRQEISTS